jgi:DNA-binding response OmpR family regulator
MSLKRILIADDDLDLVQVLTLRCKELGLEVFRSSDALHALVGAHRAEPDLILLDVKMPSGNGLSVCEMLAGDSALSKTPVIIISGQSDDDTRRRCKELGAQFVSKGPDLWEHLEPLIRAALQLEPRPETVDVQLLASDADQPSRPPGPVRILCVDDDADISKVIKLRLQPLGIEVIRAFSGMQGFWCCLDSRPDVVITDLCMPDGEGNYLFCRLKQHPLTQDTPVIILTGQNNPAVKRHLLSVGVDAYLTKPLVFDDLMAQLRRFVDVPAKRELAQSQQ